MSKGEDGLSAEVGLWFELPACQWRRTIAPSHQILIHIHAHKYTYMYTTAFRKVDSERESQIERPVK